VEDRKRTTEARILSHFPEVRTKVLASPEFAAWLSSLTALDVDGETLYLRGGDMLRDKDQVIFEWARQHGLLTDAAISRAMKAEDE
jgi:hypothetical protein